jgi:hypothetical protein
MKNPSKSENFAKHSCDRLRLTNSPASDKFMGDQKVDAVLHGFHSTFRDWRGGAHELPP